jgi:nucleotide-binding universal stress UspA family protein
MKIVLQQILVPTDFSPPSQAALLYGVAMAKELKGSIHLLHVIETVAGAEPLELQIDARKPIEDAIQAKALKDLERLLSAEDRARLHAELSLEWGSPFVEIVRYAKAHAIDLIVMGTHGRSGIRHLIIGSVAENVVRSAPCPVMTLRHPEHEFVLP